jgi:hypothetical protein
MIDNESRVLVGAISYRNRLLKAGAALTDRHAERIAELEAENRDLKLRILELEDKA